MALRSFLLLVFGLGCGDDDVPGSAAYLSPCTASSDCPAALTCHCGTCTRECAGDSECTDLRSTSTCVPSSSFTCGASAPASVCAVECASDSDCATGERCQAGFCGARPIDAGTPSERDAGSDAGFDSGVIGFDAGADGGAPDASFGDGGPGDAGLPALVIGPTETVTSFPSFVFEPEASPGACAPVCEEDGDPTAWVVYPFTTSAPMQLVSWFRHRLFFEAARQSLRQGSTCISSADYPAMEGRVIPAGTYEVITCGVFGHLMVVEPVPPPTPHTSCASALPIAFGFGTTQMRDVSTARLHYRLTVDPDSVWDAYSLVSETMDGARPVITIRRVCDDPATTLETLDEVYVDAFGRTPTPVGPYPPGVYELIFDVPPGFTFRFTASEEGF